MKGLYRKMKKARKIKRLLNRAVEEGKIKKEQLAAVPKGMKAYNDIRKKRSEYQNLLKKGKLNDKERLIIEEKTIKLNKILACVTSNDMDAMKDLAAEYDKCFPNDFDD